MTSARLTARVAVFAALIYVLSWGTSYVPNLNLIFFLVFSAGFLWGTPAGMLTGAVGMGLWTAFNPYGPAPLPITVAQIIGASLGGSVGGLFYRLRLYKATGLLSVIWLVFASILCTLLFYLPVSVADAWLFQPFWPRLMAGLAWSSISLISNALIFSLLFHVTLRLYHKERPEFTSV